MISAAMQTRTALPILAVMIASTGAAGCGSSGARSPASQRSEQSKPATQILADSEAALGHVRSFHIDATGTDLHDGPMTISGDFQIPGRLHIKLRQGGGVAEIVVLAGDDYLRANHAFWQAQKSPAKIAALLAGRWAKLPTAASANLAQFNAWTNPATAGRCIIGNNLGTVALAGRTSVGARPALILAIRGDAPGSAPGRLYVAAAGAPLPLRVVQAGPDKPGGKPDRVCKETDTSKNTTRSSDLKFSRYNSPVSITAPSGALDLQRLSGADRGATPASARSRQPGTVAATATP